MSLPIPLAVKLTSSRGERIVTAEARDLTMSWEDPGGYKAARIALYRPLAIQPDEIAYYGGLTIYDARTARVVWDGRLEDPGRSSGADGQVWELTAVGGQAHTRDKTVPLIYVDRSLDRWERRDDSSNEVKTATVTKGEEFGGTQRPTLYNTFPSGTKLTLDKSITAIYRAIADAGQELAVFDYAWDSGITSPNSFMVEFLMGNGTVYRSDMPSTSGGTFSTRTMGSNWPAGQTTPLLRLRWNTSTAFTLADDIYWAAFVAPVCVAVRYLKDGTKKTSGYTSSDETILASTVVADLLGRLLPQYDGANAVIATTTHTIDQLAYVDGVTPERVLQDMLALEGGFTWRVWERNSAGKYRFEWTAVPSSVRYEADVTMDRYESQGSADGLYDSVTVRYRDANGRVDSTVRTSTVPALAAAGLSRQGQIDLGDEVGSLANAQRAGDQWLAQHQFPPNAGTLRISRPILDLQTGRLVQPWEIRPGLIRVRGIQPRIDRLNSGTQDGVTVFRIVSAEYRAADATATLELDSFARTTPRLIAGLVKRSATVRRR